jgi:excisionase family DNA binding protein
MERGAYGLLTVREAATRLGVSEAAIRRWVTTGRLRGVRVGRAVRIDDRDLAAIIARGALDPAADRIDPALMPELKAAAVNEARRYVAALDGNLALARRCLDALEAAL